MHHLIKHLIENNMDEIVAKSILHCHVKGLHSIMLLEAPGKTIRLYIANNDHDLARNLLDKKGMPTQELSLSFHPHHCNLTLHVVKGTLINYEMERASVLDADAGLYRKHLYKSKITEGEMKFSFIQESALKLHKATRIHTGEALSMYAEAIHNVAVEAGSIAAWLVYEGKENEDYIPYCWSNTDLNKVRSEGLYIPASEFEIMELLRTADLI